VLQALLLPCLLVLDQSYPHAGMAALPPSMLNMGWEYPAQLLQGPDPEPAARQRVARDDAGQQPNHVVRARPDVSPLPFHICVKLHAQSQFTVILL